MRRWENHAARRYYQALLQQNLFGDWELLRIWGGIGNAYGRQQCIPIGDALQGELELAKTEARRRQRGYLPVAPHAF
jgi:predicted DNA-binding WGR domain protein